MRGDAAAGSKGLSTGYALEDHVSKHFNIYTYNAHSLMSEFRVELLLSELQGLSWDVVVVTETWREAQSKRNSLEGGQVCLGSGGSKGSCGVGFLLNKDMKPSNFTAVSERLAVLDISGVRILGVYLPDTNRPDDDVELVYLQMEERTSG